MDIKTTKNELQNILSGTSSSSQDALIKSVASHLRRSKSSGIMAQKKYSNKLEEAEKLIAFASKNNLLIDDINENDFVSSGAEQKVYIKNSDYVIKLNDTIYYSSWLDYFHNLLLHNYFFYDTAYELLGFHQSDSQLYAVVKQLFVRSEEVTDLSNVKQFLESNGFINNRRHDYYHAGLGIILEDLHDENVLTSQSVLYFIDTVFFLKDDVFWSAE